MELKLNVYKTQKEIEKTYSIESYDLMIAPIEELFRTIDVDSLSKLNRNDLMVEIAKIIVKNYGLVFPLLHDAFGITEEEYKRTKVKEVAFALVGMLGFSISQMNQIDSKN